MNPGDRVAVVSADRQEFLGYGEYLGMLPHPGLVDLFIERLEAVKDLLTEKNLAALTEMARAGKIGLNPKIRLDDGRELWGLECWWGSAEKFDRSGWYVGQEAR